MSSVHGGRMPITGKCLTWAISGLAIGALIPFAINFFLATDIGATVIVRYYLMPLCAISGLFAGLIGCICTFQRWKDPTVRLVGGGVAVVAASAFAASFIQLTRMFPWGGSFAGIGDGPLFFYIGCTGASLLAAEIAAGVSVALAGIILRFTRAE